MQNIKVIFLAIWAKAVQGFKDPLTTFLAIITFAAQACKLYNFPVAPEVWDSVSIAGGFLITVFHGGAGELSTSVGGFLTAVFMLLQTWHIVTLTGEQQAFWITSIVGVVGMLGFGKQQTGKPATELTPRADTYVTTPGAEVSIDADAPKKQVTG